MTTLDWPSLTIGQGGLCLNNFSTYIVPFFMFMGVDWETINKLYDM
jgi:hypothetical protein